MEFVLVQKGKALGPYSADQIRTGIRSGEISANARMWRPPWSDWVAVKNVFPTECGLTADFIAEMEARGEIRRKPEMDLFEKVHARVPSAQIEEILRQAKAVMDSPLEVRVTSSNKEELVYQNLRTAVGKGYVSRESVEKLVQELTETGGQRIFLYGAKSHLKAEHLALSLDEVGTALLGKNWTQITFPVFHNLPETPQVGSLRAYALEADPRSNTYGFAPAMAAGWILTIDASVRVEERIESTETNGASVTTQTYATKLKDAIVVLRYWEKLKVLELRVPNFPKRGTVLGLRDAILESFGAKLGFLAKFEPWLLAAACTKSLTTLLHTPAKEPTLRRISGTLLRERDRSTMKIEIENSVQDDLRDSRARRDSVTAYLQQSSIVESAIVSYQPVKGKDEIRVVIAAECPFEIAVRKTINAWYLDHVIFRLYDNS